ncbi:MAG: hypothetical protein WA921_07215 [Ahrensia sp.]
MYSDDRLSCFANRMKGVDPFEGLSSEALNRFLVSITHALKEIVFQPLVLSYEAVRFDLINEIVVRAHDEAAMALGRHSLFQMRQHILESKTCYADNALDYLSDNQQDPIDRVSFLEFVINFSKYKNPDGFLEIQDLIASHLQSQSIGLVYYEGRFCPSDGPEIRDTIHDPFWELLRDSIWDNVRTDMEQAITLRDSGGPNPSLYAARSLESTIKILSSTHGWSTGRERGAANYIDNLVSSKNGRFIEVWESEMLKRFFADVRNPDAHGAGLSPQPKLSPEQANWAIEFCMISIKSLLARNLR